MPKTMLAEPVMALIILCTLSRFEAVYAITDPTKQAIPTIPKITPTPKSKMKTNPISTELTVVNVTNIKAALPPRPCRTPAIADLCKCVCPYF